jgi:hypothetical protein
LGVIKFSALRSFINLTGEDQDCDSCSAAFFILIDVHHRTSQRARREKFRGAVISVIKVSKAVPVTGRGNVSCEVRTSSTYKKSNAILVSVRLGP